MAVTNENSNLMANVAASPPVLNDGSVDGTTKIWTFTQGAAAGDDLSTARLFVLKANEVLSTHTMSVAFSAFGAARTLNIGHEAYTVPGSTETAADPNAIADGIDVSAAGRAVVADAPTSNLDSFGPFNVDIVIVAQVDGGTIPAAATINGTAIVGKPM